MPNKKKLSVAEQIDKMMQRIALGTFLVAVAYAIVTAKFLVTEETGDVLNIIAKVLGVLIIVLILPGFIKFVNLKRKNRDACREPEGFVIEMFNKHNQSVVDEVPADRLLVFEAKQGWGPLCHFLEVPIPEEDFPYVNTTQQFNDTRTQDQEDS